MDICMQMLTHRHAHTHTCARDCGWVLTPSVTPTPSAQSSNTRVHKKYIWIYSQKNLWIKKILRKNANLLPLHFSKCCSKLPSKHSSQLWHLAHPSDMLQSTDNSYAWTWRIENCVFYIGWFNLPSLGASSANCLITHLQPSSYFYGVSNLCHMYIHWCLLCALPL